MEKLVTACLAFIFSINLCYGQGQISRPSQTTVNKNQTPKKTEPILPNSTETINGITVNWDGVNQSQKNAITELLNNMVFVEGGTFMKGKGNPSYNKQYIAGFKTTVPSFYMSKFETDQKLWKCIMGKNPSYFKGDNLPVEQVTWKSLHDFIKKLNNLTGLNFKLPSEEEWEYASRGGKLSKDYIYSGSNNLEDIAWIDKNSKHRTHPIGSKKPNELGIYDMTGNVWEWTSTSYTDDKNRLTCIGKGGSFDSVDCHHYEYFNWDPDPNKTIGFRLIL